MAKVAGHRPGGRGGQSASAASSNKIFERIGDQPVFIRTLELFANRDDVCQVQLVVSAADMRRGEDALRRHLGFMGVQLVQGGATRPQSVRNALAQRARAEADFVCVHDAVRPCVSPLWIDAVFAEAGKSRRGHPGLPGARHAEEGLGRADAIDETRAAERPVGGPDAAGLPQGPAAQGRTQAGDRRDRRRRSWWRPPGTRSRVVLGDPRNIKITTPADLALAAAVIDSLPKPKPKARRPFDEAQWYERPLSTYSRRRAGVVEAEDLLGRLAALGLLLGTPLRKPHAVAVALAFVELEGVAHLAATAP